MSEEPRNTRQASARERRVGTQIRRDVMQLILDRRLPPGAPLPTEAELMESLGVSRNSVREALKALQALDIVEIRHGYGTYVGQASLTPFVDGLTFRTLARVADDHAALTEILQVREVLEEGLIRRVAGGIDDAELARLESIVGRMEEAAHAGESFPDLDREFHETLYETLGNDLVPQLLAAFWHVFHRVAKARGWTRDPAPEVTACRHRDILTALRARDVAGAEQAMADHFRGIEARPRDRGMIRREGPGSGPATLGVK
ncbi:FadR/GntR family transcriptional regulator [Streptomyces sp. LHD-70]|uniref:FadR/GntR family transcriptional regulator n=1 Tax=Streptomyces sp. LHD-70 TaxID=3072140 RepID=UPI0028108521|nr:FadR/GntR family transcriptional regulator [Streptomyces sp. LHD-70]MDQ8701047.1 FadR/GntR family transcriptional regulator [Streptomyces sp. LHD-70]